MNTSPVLLVTLLLSACHAEKQMDSNASSISPTKKAQNTEAPREASCPDPTDIEPCVCTKIGDSDLIMDCHLIQDEYQLWQVFSADFPSTAFYRFFIWDNAGLKVLENGVFHNITFQEIIIEDSALEVVEYEVLTPSLSTLISINIEYCPLTTFPYERLPEFTSLGSLGLVGINVSSIPPLSSSTIEFLSLSYNPISTLPPDAFKGLPAIRWLYLVSCQLTEITPGAFKDLTELIQLYVSGNRLSYIQSLTFEMVSSHDHSVFIQLALNNIDFLEEDAFRGVPVFSRIIMNNNTLTYLPETVWRPVLEKEIVVSFLDNPLKCGCDVAWLVRNPQLLTLASGQCADGKYLTDLDSADFSMCG